MSTEKEPGGHVVQGSALAWSSECLPEKSARVSRKRTVPPPFRRKIQVPLMDPAGKRTPLSCEPFRFDGEKGSRPQRNCRPSLTGPPSPGPPPPQWCRAWRNSGCCSKYCLCSWRSLEGSGLVGVSEDLGALKKRIQLVILNDLDGEDWFFALEEIEEQLSSLDPTTRGSDPQVHHDASRKVAA